ncbi:MAG: hypothetical protein JW751_09835 [Polyangiaceae bacterium]|nr:hypothetical protein [Polyangiaceae bacterium]
MVTPEAISHPGDVRQAIPMVFMRFRPAWVYIDGIQEFGRFFCQTTFRDEQIATRARIIIQETLENAVKYSTPGPSSELELSIFAEGEHIEISVSSLPDPAHLDTLKQEIAWLSQADPESAYFAAFERAASCPDSPSRLGLARIRYEGSVELSVGEMSDGRIRITARGSI